MEKSFRKHNAVSCDDVEWVGVLLKKAFPEARSDNELSELVAEILTTRKRSVDPKTVRNWLGGFNTPHFRYIIPILSLATSEFLFQLIDVEDEE